MDIKRQIELGLLVCPKTKQKLMIDNQFIENTAKTERYKFLNGRIPILLTDTKWAEEYTIESDSMNKEYAIDYINKKKSLLSKIRSKLTQDYRTESSKRAFLGLFDDLPSDPLCISVGGGPMRAHPMLFNLNIGPFPNVDVVADAHSLPYADESVDVVHSEAIFEHLYNPGQAAKEIYRILKMGGKAYICTPFLQPYHGYPHHYQNYTITGHKLLFESVGFRIVEAGTCVGPVYTIVSLVATFLDEYFPYPLNKLLRFTWGSFGVIVRPLDKFINKRKNAHILASTTYVILEKF